MRSSAPFIAATLAFCSAVAYADCKPPTPTGLKVAHTGPECRVTLSWSAVPAMAGCPDPSYYIVTSENGGPKGFSNVGTRSSTVYPTQKNVPTTFQVFASRGKKLDGPHSAPVAFTCGNEPPRPAPPPVDACAPAAPTGFTLVNDGTFCGVTLKWNPVAAKPNCPGGIVYGITTTENGGPPAEDGWDGKTTRFVQTKKDVATTFQVQAGNDQRVNGPLSAKLSFKCDRVRIHWSPDRNERLHAPCINGTAPCGRYLDWCQGPRVDKGVLSANCVTKTMKLTALTLPVPCKGMIDYDRATERLLCVPQ